MLSNETLNTPYTQPVERVKVCSAITYTINHLIFHLSVARRITPKCTWPPPFRPLCPATDIRLLKSNAKLANTRDDDERLPIHWAVSYNHLPIVELLVSRRDFDPDVQVRHLPVSLVDAVGGGAQIQTIGRIRLDAVDDGV